MKKVKHYTEHYEVTSIREKKWHYVGCEGWITVYIIKRLSDGLTFTRTTGNYRDWKIATTKRGAKVTVNKKYYNKHNKTNQRGIK